MEKAPKIQCVNVTKSYRDHTVLKQVNLECGSGEIAGIIGRNGAGKTVLFKAICGLTAIDSGEILIDGEKKSSGAILQSVGVIIEEPAFLAHTSGYKNLEYLYMIRNRVNREHLNRVLSQVGLDPNSKKPVDKYSLGMRQRLRIIPFLGLFTGPRTTPAEKAVGRAGKLRIDAVIGISMLHPVREVGAGAVARAAADHLVCIGDSDGILGVGIGEHPALIHPVIPALRPPPLHMIAPRLVVGGQLHQAQIRPVVGIHIA